MANVLIIGKGNVGEATARNFKSNIIFHDPPKGITNNNFYEYDYIFICVDTIQQGPQDYNDLDSVLKDLYDYEGTVIIRSTISPDKITSIKSAYDFNLIVFPEFMDHNDFINKSSDKSRIILGGELFVCEYFVDNMKSLGYNMKLYSIVSDIEASLIKLSANAALATKLITFNMIYNICKNYGVNYELVRKGIVDDARIGSGHTLVPSPDDGKLGFGGHCLPKDILAMAEIDKNNFFKFVENINKTLGR